MAMAIAMAIAMVMGDADGDTHTNYVLALGGLFIMGWRWVMVT